MKFFKNKKLTESIDLKHLDLDIVEGGSYVHKKTRS